MKNLKIFFVWLLALSFIASGILKALDMDMMTAAVFTKANYSQLFFYIVAIYEFLGGALLLFPNARKYGVAICVIMLGAIGTHLLIKDNLTHFIAPVVILCLSVFILRHKPSGLRVQRSTLKCSQKNQDSVRRNRQKTIYFNLIYLWQPDTGSGIIPNPIL